MITITDVKRNIELIKEFAAKSNPIPSKFFLEQINF